MANDLISPHRLMPEGLFQCYAKIIPQINTATVENYSDVLFDQDVGTITPEQEAFLNNTTLESIQFEEHNGDTFFIVNQSKEEKMAFSNRDPTKGELRGYVLREKLEALKASNNQLTLYQAISSLISNPETSDVYYSFQSAFEKGLNEASKATLLTCAKKLSPRIKAKEELTEAQIKALYDEEYYAYFKNCPESIKPLANNLQATAKMLTRLLYRAHAKKDDKEQIDISEALRKTYQLMPLYRSPQEVVFPQNYEALVGDYEQQAQKFADNPDYTEQTNLRNAGIMMLTLGAIALASFAAALIFPPLVFFISQMAFHGTAGVLALKAGLASTAALSTSLGFFAARSEPARADKAIQDLSLLSVEIERKLSPRGD